MRLLPALLVALPLAAAAAEPEIVTWTGNTPEWNQRLGVTLMRQGCSQGPAGCLDLITSTAVSQGVDRWALAITADADKLADVALEYSVRSLANPRLVEIDIDDLVGTMTKWDVGTPGRANEVLAGVVGNVKSRNARLRVGITLYEDDLASPALSAIPAATRAQIDRVSLYLHYRANRPNFPEYVAEVRRLFPSADIWAGSYAYDRIDYRPCAEHGQQPCSVDDEMTFFEQSLTIQLDLLDQGQIQGIEFYPGYFGLEDQWPHWSKPNYCQPARVEQCIATTRKLREIVAQQLQSWRAGRRIGAAGPAP